MIDVPWSASADLHLGGGAIVHVGTLQSCCQKFCESSTRERLGAHIRCDTIFQLHHDSTAEQISAVTLYDLVTVYITTFEPWRM